MKRSLFRLFVTKQYYLNREEYESSGEKQPYTFEQYVSNNLAQLKQEYRVVRKEFAQ